ncbi:bromodomain containing 2 [Aphelenchoides avenae]|nr:bromodomain containing 2 [Aphelenchus avenae]
MARLREGMKGVYEVEKILDQRWTNGKLEYLIKWLGFDDPAENTWELAKDCDCPDAKKEFEKEQKKKGQEARSGSVASSRSTTTTRSSSAATSSSSIGKTRDTGLKRKSACTSDEEGPVPKTVARSSSHIPVLPTADEPINDDDQIDAILLKVQAEQNRVAERFTELNKYSIELQQLKLQRRDASKQRLPLPPLPDDLHRAVHSVLATVAAPSGSGRSSSPKSKPTVVAVSSKKARDDPKKHLDVKPMTIEAKQRLAVNIEKLPDKQREKVAELIMSREKDFKNSNSEDFEVDLDTLDPTLLHELNDYVRKSIESKVQEPQTPSRAAQKEIKKTERKRSFPDRPSLQGMPPHGAVIRSVLHRLDEKKADTFSLSESDSSSSDSSSSDSSDSEPGRTDESGQSRNKPLPTASAAALNDSPANSPVNLDGSLKQSNKQPLMSAEKTHQLKQTDDPQKHNCELAAQSAEVSSDSPWPSIGSLLAQPTASRDAEMQRMKEAERERRRREADQVDPIGQSEKMANFEDTL